MPKAVLLVLTNPSDPDHEEEFNEWYTNTHLPDLLAIDGFVGATRYRLSETQLAPSGEGGKHRYLAIYEIDSDDLAVTMKNLREAAAGGMVISEALDTSTPPGTFLFEEIAPRQGAR